MILPKGQLIHENLNTSFTNFEQLLNELRAIQFTGYLKLTGWKYTGVIFMDSGNLVNVVEEKETNRTTGIAALEGLRTRAGGKEGVISVHQLEGDLVALLAGSVQRAALYEQLSTDLTTFDRLIGKLVKEQHTGHVEIESADKSNAMIFYEKGAPVSIFHSTNGTTTLGDAAMDKLIESVRAGATFNVYRSDPIMSLGQGFVPLEMIEAWQNLLVLVQNFVDKATAAGVFSTQFKRSCLENVEAYPFLDPFAGFEFKDDRITLEMQTNNTQFTQGLANTFRSAATKLDERGGRALRDALRAASHEQRVALETWGIRQALETYFQ